jgi:hypothetical protein
MVTCGACQGSGQCRTCAATGQVQDHRCPACYGNRVCPKCGGTGRSGDRPYER